MPLGILVEVALTASHDLIIDPIDLNGEWTADDAAVEPCDTL